MNIKLSNLTLGGWLLAAATIGLIVVLMLISGNLWYGLLPEGRYPAILLAAPGLGIGILFFVLCAWVLKAAGLPVVKPGPTDRQPSGQGPPSTPGAVGGEGIPPPGPPTAGRGPGSQALCALPAIVHPAPGDVQA